MSYPPGIRPHLRQPNLLRRYHLPRLAKSARTALALLFLGMVCLESVDGQTFTGHLYSDLYVWSADSSDYVQPYIGLRSQLNLLKSENGRNLGFVSNLRWSDNLADDTSSTARFFVYESYLQFKCSQRRISAHAGRQFVYSPAGSALIDGGRIRIGPYKRVRLDLYGGSEVNRLTPTEVQSLSDYLVLGGRLSSAFGNRMVTGFNWMLRKAEEDVVYHRISFDASYSPGRWHLYGRAGYDPASSELSEILGRVGFAPGKWYLSAEFLYRVPSVNSNSVFAIIDYERYQQFRTELRRKVWRAFSIYTQADVTLFKDDEAASGSLGITNGLFSLAWVHQSGAFGNNDGVSGFANLTVREVWHIYGHARLTQYVVQEAQADRSDAYSAALGVSRSLGRGFRGRSEIQLLSNAVSDSDVRLYMRLSKNFSLGLRGNGNE